MTTITITNPDQTTDDRQFFHSHSAKTWLLLAGYLPVSESDDEWKNHFTGSNARLNRGSAE